jgi:hypothetical protein
MRAAVRLFVLMAVAFVFCSPGLLAQASDLSGTWVFDEARSDGTAVTQNARLGRGGRGGPPAGMVITQSADELTVQRGNQSFTYNLDGSESFGPPGGETKSTVAWDQGALIVTWKREFFAGNDLGYQTSTGRDVYTRSGTTLTVERTVTNARGTGGTQVSKSVYSKS